jgi:hypothetical protein
MTELSPAAQAVLSEAMDRMTNGECDSYARWIAAAALCAAADQVAPSDAVEPRNNLPAAIECQRIRAELLAIAAELEAHQ